MSFAVAVTRSTLSSSLALWRGTVVLKPIPRQPERPLELYDIENCPYCRVTREALTAMDVDVLVKPCPSGGTRFRAMVKSTGGKEQFPYLHDPNTGQSMYESADIVDYIATTYEGRVRAKRGVGRSLALATSMMASGVNGRKGIRARASRAPETPLELYSFESSPYARLVREALCELELPYLLRNMGKGNVRELGPPVFRDVIWKSAPDSTRNRTSLYEHTGKVQVPYLIDPNTNTEMFESAHIVRYLNRTYAL